MGGFFTDCDRRWASTLSRASPLPCARHFLWGTFLGPLARAHIFYVYCRFIFYGYNDLTFTIPYTFFCVHRLHATRNTPMYRQCCQLVWFVALSPLRSLALFIL